MLPVDESLDWGVERDEFAPTDEYAHVFDQPGVYPYYCSIHGTEEAGMVGADRRHRTGLIVGPARRRTAREPISKRTPNTARIPFVPVGFRGTLAP